MTHELKVWPVFFEAMIKGDKRFEVRKNDRNFRVGDLLALSEWDPETKDYTGRSIVRRIRYILPGGQFGIDPEYCVMTI